VKSLPAPESAAQPHLFFEPEEEVRRMIVGDHFPRFCEQNMTTNIDQKEVDIRKGVSFVNFCLAVALTLCLWLIEPSLSRYYRLVTFPFFFLFVTAALSANSHVCSALVMRETKIDNGLSWWQAVLEPGQCRIEDEVTRHELRRISRRNDYLSFLFAFILTGIAVILGVWNDR